MADRYNPPPNWPRPPADWSPPPGWKPDPAWGPPPYGWQVWVDDSPPRSRFGRRPLGVALGFVVGVTILLGYVFVFSAPTETNVVTIDPDDQPTRRVPKTDRNADRGPVRTGHQAPAPYSAEPDPPRPSPEEPERDPPATPPVTSEPSDSGNSSRHHGRSGDRRRDADPWFVTCQRARAAGYGPYYFGRDIEYFWYRDRDRDGVVCE